jgi:hypothetical protein
MWRQFVAHARVAVHGSAFGISVWTETETSRQIASALLWMMMGMVCSPPAVYSCLATVPRETMTACRRFNFAMESSSRSKDDRQDYRLMTAFVASELQN